jgi:hypothetical protein
MNAAHLRALAHERFLSLLMNRRASGDTRSNDTLRKVAAREIIREHRGAGSTGSTPTTSNSGFELLFAKVWGICERMSHYSDQRSKLEVTSNSKTEPTITDNPIIADEQVADRHLKDTVVTFPVVTGSGKQSIPDSEYPSRFVDQTTNNWRNSILENQERAKQRDIASARHRQTSSRYFG